MFVGGVYLFQTCLVMFYFLDHWSHKTEDNPYAGSSHVQD